jgi:O-antigen/teichoic acid export membrane protein
VTVVRTLSNEGSRGTARGTIQLLAGRVLFLASGYVITVVLARELGPAAYGTYGLIMSLLLWLEGVAGLGIPRATMAMLPGSGHALMIAQSAHILSLGTSLLLFTLCWLFASHVAQFFAIQDGAWLFRIAVLDLPFFGVYLAYQGILQARQQFGSLTISLIVYSLAKLLGVLSLFVIDFSVAAALVVNVLATVAALVYLMGTNPPQVFLPERALLRRMLALAAPLAVYGLAINLLLSGHLWLLRRVSDASDIVLGYYVAALNIARLPTVVTTVLSGVVLASISLALAREDDALAHRYLQSASRFVLVVLLPSCAFGALHARELMTFIYSEAYAGSALFFGLLLSSFGVFTVLSTMLNSLVAAGRSYLATGIVLAMLPALLLLSILLTPIFGPVGVASALLVTLTCGTVVGFVAAFQRFGAPARAATVARVVAATAVVMVPGWLLELDGGWVLVELAGLMVLYLFLLALMRELREEDLKPFAVWK